MPCRGRQPARGGQPPAEPCAPAGAPATGLMLRATWEETGVRGGPNSPSPGCDGHARAGAGDADTGHRQGLSPQPQLCCGGHLPSVVVCPHHTGAFSTSRSPVPSPPAPHGTRSVPTPLPAAGPALLSPSLGRRCHSWPLSTARHRAKQKQIPRQLKVPFLRLG